MLHDPLSLVERLADRNRWGAALVGAILIGLLVPVLAAAGGYYGFLGPSIPLFFLVPVLIASTLGGRIAGVLVSLVAIVVWDWSFIPPLYTPTIYSARDLLALVVFLLVAVLTGHVATVVRQRAEEAGRRAGTSEALYDLSMALIGGHDLAAVLPILAQRLLDTFDLEACAVLLHDAGTSTWSVAATAGRIPDDLNIARSGTISSVLSWVRTSGEMRRLDEAPGRTEHDRRSGGREDGQVQFWPLQADGRLVGVLQMIYKPHVELDPERDRLLKTLVNGAAIALEQERLSREEQEATLARESDRLKSALLSSVSHDLRTPLAGIKAAASSLLQEDVQWDQGDWHTFATDIDAEADRLARLVSNLLDLSRIEAGAITPNRQWEDVGELLERVVRRMRREFPEHPIVLSVAEGLSPARYDVVHIEQALTNLIENAAQYSFEGAPIEITACLTSSAGVDRHVAVSVTDHGPGIALAERERIFDRFYRVTGSARRGGGTGMGLAIVKGLIEANGGRVTLESAVGRGSRFTLALPLDRTTDRVAPSEAPAGLPEISLP